MRYFLEFAPKLYFIPKLEIQGFHTDTSGNRLSIDFPSTHDLKQTKIPDLRTEHVSESFGNTNIKKFIATIHLIIQ